MKYPGSNTAKERDLNEREKKHMTRVQYYERFVDYLL